eukprot:g30683.t1
MERVRCLGCWSALGDAEVAVRPVKELELHLGEGRTNQNFIVDCGSRRFFVRLGADLPFFGVNRQREQAAARAAEAVGLGPAVRPVPRGAGDEGEGEREGGRNVDQ